MTSHWGDSGDERQFVTRLVAGALIKRAQVRVIHLAAADGGSRTERDGGFEVRRLSGSAPRPVSQGVLLSSLRAGGAAERLPRLAGRDLLSLEGGGSGEIISALGESEPDVVVICGVQPGWPHAWPRLLPKRPRTVIWPMVWEDALLGLPGYRDLLQQADVICAIGGAEHRRLSELGGPGSPSVERLRVPISVDRVAAAHRLPGLTSLSGYAVFLRGSSGGPDPDYGRLRELVPGLAVADVSHEEWRIHDQRSEWVVPYPASRTNLWRLMFHAIGTVDLRPGHLMGREMLESLLLGTPVAAPAGSRSCEIIEDSGGGIVFSGQGELVVALGLLLDQPERANLSEQGRHWAEERHSDQNQFAAAVRAAVLGPAEA